MTPQPNNRRFVAGGPSPAGVTHRSPCAARRVLDLACWLTLAGDALLLLGIVAARVWEGAR